MAEPKPGVHAQIFTHDVGLTEQDAIQLKTLLESNGTPTAVHAHIDRRVLDAVLIGAFVTAEKGQIALASVSYDTQYIFPPDYSEIEGGDLSGFTIGLGYMSTHSKEFREESPVDVHPSSRQ